MIRHFRILPTDPRYKELTEEQCELLFLDFLNSPTDEECLQFYREKEESKAVVEELPIEDLEEMGYSDEEIKNIIKAVVK